MDTTRKRGWRLAGVALALAAAGASAGPARGADDWQWALGLEQGATGGWVRVRENSLEGTRLGLSGDLGADRMQTLRLQTWRPLGGRGELHLGLATHRLSGRAVLPEPVLFNGTTIAAGPVRTAVRFRDFVTLDAHYWWLLAGAGDAGGGLWGSLGLRYDMLNFRLKGTIASDSIGQETKEDFYVQELPVPMLGLHLRHPLGTSLTLVADADWGRLPWVNSLRREGGTVKLSQTESGARLGLDWDGGGGWHWQGYLFHRYLGQAERSGEDGNVIHLRDSGVGVQASYRFGGG